MALLLCSFTDINQPAVSGWRMQVQAAICPPLPFILTGLHDVSAARDLVAGQAQRLADLQVCHALAAGCRRGGDVGCNAVWGWGWGGFQAQEEMRAEVCTGRSAGGIGNTADACNHREVAG